MFRLLKPLKKLLQPVFSNKMEVTKSNFPDALKILKSSIKKADFISIDGEFTGLSTLKGRGLTYDTMEEKYEKLRRGSSEFMLVQYGICLFTWNDENEKYEAMPFTFYIFPRPYKRFFNDVMFMCQSSSIDFLVSNGFDFNKLFCEGMSFMTPWEQKKAQVRLNKELSFLSNKNEKSEKLVIQEKKDSDSTKSSIFIPKDQREYIEKICELVNDFVKTSEELSLDLPTGNAFQRKLIYEKIEEKYPMGLYLESAVNENNQKFIRVLKVTARDNERKREEKYQKEVEDLDEVIGFTKVMNLLAESKKPIIGHNMFYDLFFTVTHFFSQPPHILHDYKLLLTSLFPLIIDTKLMSTTQPLQQKCSGTSLKALMNCIEDDRLPKPNIVDSTEIEDHVESSKQYHQAGHDAYCTGFIFISLAKCLFESANVDLKQIDFTNDVLTPFVNRINILGIRDIKYMDITGEDKTPCREHVFQLNFPTGWKETDFVDLFSPICSLSRPTVWINESSVYVTLANKEKSKEVIEILVRNGKPTDSYQVIPYVNDSDSTVVASKSLILEEKSSKRKKKRDHTEIEDGELESDDGEDDKVKKQKMFKEADDW